MSDPVRVRFAPSPTGYLHIGGARTALYNWLLARQTGGTFVLRMEDTDEERNTEAARKTIFKGLEWLGLVPDEGPEQGGPHGPYSQSERMDIYLEWAEELKRRGALYPCFATREELAESRARQEAAKESIRYDGRYRDLDPAEARRRIEAGEEHTWRLKVPQGETLEIRDLVRGTVRVKTEDVEDIVLIRANGAPVYNLVVVIDDHLMKISHVLRGEDHLTNTFKQVLIYRALGWETPVFAHLPLILGPTGQGKLSKRKHPEAALELYQEKGYPVEGVVNWLALVGWSFDDKTEVMTRQELIERFSVERVNSGAARLPLEKLDWICGDWIRRMDEDRLVEEIRPFLQGRGWVEEPPTGDDLRRMRLLAKAARERLRSFGEIVDFASWVYRDELEFEEKARANLGKPGAEEVLAGYLEDVLPRAPIEDPEAMEEQARAWCAEKELGFGKLVHPIRAALTGRSTGPGLFDCFALLGRDRAEERLRKGLELARLGP